MAASRIFLDVGANTGQTLAAVIDPVFRFDVIHCFEPVRDCWKKLAEIRDKSDFPPRIVIETFGLWNQSCQMPVFQPGSKGAGLWKKDNGRSEETEMCRFTRASDWLRANVAARDTVFLKLNCEGAECDILDDLLDSGEFEKVTYAMIDFDVRKIASQKHREAELRARLEHEGIGFPRVAYSKDVMRGETHQARIKNWIRIVTTFLATGAHP